MPEEKLGIENIKKVLGTFIDVGILGYKSYADDNKISAGEAVKLAFKLPSLWSASKNIKEAIPEAKDLDPLELAELMDFVMGKLKEISEIED